MIKTLWKECKAFIAFVVIITGVVFPSVLAYKVGVEDGKRQMAKYIQEIRRLERIDALAPRRK
jgi:L-lactate permease